MGNNEGIKIEKSWSIHLEKPSLKYWQTVLKEPILTSGGEYNLYQYKTNVQKTFQENMQNKFEP